MHRLLRSKGYEFPAVRKEDAAVLNPSDNIKSIDEIQREERIAQSAKLQELVRRGRPQDLKEANDLMKIMSGFKHDETMDEARNRVNEDVEKVSRKASILDEMLNNATNTGTFDPSDETIAELISSLRVAQPKLQTLVQEESDDQEQVGKLLSLNDKINSILQKADLLKQGDVANASKVKVAGGGGLNLIDFDDDEPAPAASNAPAPTANDAMADLLGDLGGLSFEPKTGSSSNITGAGSLGNFGAINLLGSPSTTREQSPSVDILSAFSTTQKAAPAQPAALDPFQFDFSSVSAPAAATNLVTSGDVKIDYVVDHKQPLSLTFKFSNTSPIFPVSKPQFSIAVTKAFELTMEPPSGSVIAPSSAPVTQKVVIKHKNGEAFSSAKIKYKFDYEQNSTAKEVTGVATISI
ncbi:hypothetical protein OGAPHI_001487 [Ogataea philodendri]|uniref:Uncharacterized protein n=1 Tax=Ogataea philodendri TaxID=1378263 RepID=A0A9P8T8V0_9ASCO|nr:uncharacterized protein OGAPHI_001487 [Ogataea philodendri]KAH3669366.1 hypothetical protein OGAPHI_001487 [Ogataea philodendri]